MGNLVDTYVLCPKYEVDEKGCRNNYIDRRDSEILAMVENETDRSFLAEVFNQKFHITDLFQKTTEFPDNLWMLVDKYETQHPDWRFVRRYREDSFSQRMRKLFFTTLVIIENDYDGDKQNKFVIVRSDELIFIQAGCRYTLMSEDQFMERKPEDQKFCLKAILEIGRGCATDCEQEKL